MQIRQDRERRGYSIRKHTFPKQSLTPKEAREKNNRETLSVIGSGVTNSRFSVNLNENKKEGIQVKGDRNARIK